ncbi:hypothetical protein P7C73_g2968, partial [Tremellales sp. Uapishka_1]
MASYPLGYPTLHGSGNQIKTQTEWYADPTNPYGPPRARRVFDIVERPSLWKRILGGGIDWDKGERYPARSAMHEAPTTSSTRPLPVPSNPEALDKSKPSPFFRMTTTPFPENYDLLPRAEKKALKEKRKSEKKVVEGMMKVQRENERLVHEEEKNRIKQEERDRKQKHKEEKWHRKHPWQPRPLPIPRMPDLEMYPTALEPKKPPMEDPMRWMMLPTMEEFGVRRPLNPNALGGPNGRPWPMMSRTMTHAMVDMGREENVRMMQAGTMGFAGYNYSA